jgi:archaellum component FlaC
MQRTPEAQALMRKLRKARRRPDPSDVEDELEDLLLSGDAKGEAMKLAIGKQDELMEPLDKEIKDLEREKDEINRKIGNLCELYRELSSQRYHMVDERRKRGRQLREWAMKDDDDEDEEEDE